MIGCPINPNWQSNINPAVVYAIISDPGTTSLKMMRQSVIVVSVKRILPLVRGTQKYSNGMKTH